MKKIIALLLSVIMLLSMAACGGDKPDNDDTKPKPKGLQAGFYALYAVEEGGEYVDNETLTQLGMDKMSYIEVIADGIADVMMEGDTMSCTYDKEYFTDAEGNKIAYKLKDGLLELSPEEGMTMFYKLGSKGDTPDPGEDPSENPGDNAPAFTEDVAEAFYGDWHGWCLMTDGTGEYEDEIDNEFEMLARYAFDEDGNCTPWMAIYSSSEDNFKNVSLRYDESDEYVYLSGQLFGLEIRSISKMYEDYGSLCLTIYLEGDKGTLDIVVCLRHPDAEWDTYDYPCMPEGAQEYYKGMTFEERVEAYKLDPSDLPKLP